MKRITVIVAANVTYDGETCNTRLVIEYEHTGKLYFKTRNHFTQSEEIAERWKTEGKKVTENPGHYFIKRMALPTTLENGKADIWYINNPGDAYKVNKVSKYAQKIHSQLSQNIIPKGIEV